MKRTQYMVLLNAFVSVISMHAGRDAKGLEFPEGRVHRYLLHDKARAQKVKVTKESITRLNAAQDAVVRLLELYDTQSDEKAAKIIAIIDPSTLESLDLDALD
jgi:hypothetical protein